MEQNLNKRAKEIISEIQYITIATCSKDGKPWNSPVYSAFDENYNFYWISWRQNQHSQNIKNNNQVFLVIYDSTVPEGEGEGVYVQAKAYELENNEEIKHALKYLDGQLGNRVNKQGRHTVLQFQGDMPRRAYKAVPEKIWMNAEGDIDGEYVDKRVEITL